MNVLSHPGLHCRDFGSSLLSVSDLKEWLAANRLRIATTPSIDEYDFVQIESLLCAVERAASAVASDDEAKSIVSADPILADHEAADDAPRWLFGAEAHRKWRVKITYAIMNGDLCVFDFGSKLPIKIPEAAVRAVAKYGPTAEDLAVGIYAPTKSAQTEGQSGISSSSREASSAAAGAGLSKRERQIRAIEAAVKAANLDALKIPTGEKSKLRVQCMQANPELFGAGPDPFNDAWSTATKSTPPRLRMAEHSKFASR